MFFGWFCLERNVAQLLVGQIATVPHFSTVIVLYFYTSIHTLWWQDSYSFIWLLTRATAPAVAIYPVLYLSMSWITAGEHWAELIMTSYLTQSHQCGLYILCTYSATTGLFWRLKSQQPYRCQTSCSLSVSLSTVPVPHSSHAALWFRCMWHVLHV